MSVFKNGTVMTAKERADARMMADFPTKDELRKSVEASEKSVKAYEKEMAKLASELPIHKELVTEAIEAKQAAEIELGKQQAALSFKQNRYERLCKLLRHTNLDIARCKETIENSRYVAYVEREENREAKARLLEQCGT